MLSANILLEFKELYEFKQELIKHLGLVGGRTGSISCAKNIISIQMRFSKSIRKNCDKVINGSWADCFKAGYESNFTGTVLYFGRSEDVCLFHGPKSKNKMLETLRNFQANLRRVDDLFETERLLKT